MFFCRQKSDSSFRKKPFRVGYTENVGAVKIFRAVFERNGNLYACQFVVTNVIKTELGFY